MTAYVALLRAVNVGGTGRLPMTELRTRCERLGYADVRTYIASGNVVFRATDAAQTVKRLIEDSLEEFFGKRVAVHVRTGEEMARVAAANPFPGAPPNHTVAIFLDTKPPRSMLDDVRHQTNERIELGHREIYVAYGSGMGQSKLRIPAAEQGTARNMNSVARLAAMAAE